LLAAIPPALAVDPCFDKADMALTLACVRESARAADDALDDAHRRLEERHGREPGQAARLREARQAWLRYRDAHLAARFPAADPRVEYGSVYPLCAALVRRDFTRTRARELERWPGACGSPEGGKALAAGLDAIRRDYADQPEFLARLEAAQSAWQAFSAAEAAAAAPLSRPGQDCGSGHAAARAAVLDAWRRGVEEGDVCAGSIRIRSVAKRVAPAVAIAGEQKKTVGTIRELVNGDRACYVTLTDDNGERFDEMAAFTLCERERELRGRRVRLSYELANVLAAECQGNMDCGKSDRVVLIRSVTLLPPVP
jgi:uncharacterized protein YecT (DUF1311 family)